MKQIGFSKRSLLLDGHPTFLLSGEVQNYRLSPDQWRDRLEKVKAMGCNCVGTYVGWNWHCPTPDTVDFASPSRDIGRFLDLCQELGLYVIVRPGPYVCNEWDLGGHPGWLMNQPSGDWRTGDPAYLAFARKWYKQVNEVVVPRQYTRGGPVILYQIENEHHWGDGELFKGLADQAIEDGIDVPRVSNSGGRTFQTGCGHIIDGWDLYTDVGELWRWRGWFDHVYRLLPRDGMMMVLESMAGRHAEWGMPYPTEKALPAEWMTTVAQLAIGMGANLVNFFVAAAGTTPVGFGSDHICTDYYPDAAIKPWGALGPKFYQTRLLAEPLHSVSRQLSEAVRVDMGWGTDNPHVECLARRGADGLFMFVNNISVKPQRFVIEGKDGRRLPAAGQLQIGARETQFLMADVVLDSAKLLLATTPVFRIWEDDEALHIVLRGNPGQEGQLILERDGEQLKVDYTCEENVERQVHTIADRDVDVLATTTDVARRTWFLNHAGQIVPVFSNIDLVRPESKSRSAALQFETEAGADGWIITTWPEPLKIDNVAPQPIDRADGLQAYQFQAPRAEFPKVQPGPPAVSREPSDWLEASPIAGAGWQRITMAPDGQIHLPERPGEIRYITDFDVDADAVASLRTLEFAGLYGAEVEVFLNGHLLGVHPEHRPHVYHVRPAEVVQFDVASHLKAGRNRLALRAVIIGRHNSGIREQVGLLGPVLLYGERRTLELPNWAESPVDLQRRWRQDELDAVSDPHSMGLTSGRELPTLDLTQPRERPTPPPGDAGDWHSVRWYHTRCRLPEMLRGKHLLLEWDDDTDQLWGYANGRLLGHRFRGAPRRLLISDYGEAAEIDLTVALRLHGHNGGTSLSKPMRLVSAEGLLDVPWYVQERPFAPDDQVTDWQPPDDIDATEYGLWLRQEVTVSPESPATAPLYVELQGEWNSHATLYWNGQPIGQFACTSEQRRFYVPGELIQEQNTVLVRVLGHGRPARCGSLNIGHYFHHAVFALTLGRRHESEVSRV